MARSFSGTGQYATSGSNYNNNAQLSLAFWCYVPTGHGNVQFDRILELGGYTVSPAGGITLDFDDRGTGAGGISVDVFAGSSTVRNTDFAYVGSTYTYATNTWFHLCVTSDTTGPSSKFYANGVQQGATNTTLTRATNVQRAAIASLNVTLGNNLGQFSIAGLAFWHGRILDAAEIAALASGFDPMLVAPASLVEDFGMFGVRSPELGIKTTDSFTLTGSPVAFAHPRLILPRRTIIGATMAANGVATGGFKIWYTNVNVIGGGVHGFAA